MKNYNLSIPDIVGKLYASLSYIEQVKQRKWLYLEWKKSGKPFDWFANLLIYSYFCIE